MEPEFVVQDAVQPFARQDKSLIKENSIDYVNTSGIVGHHLTKEAFTNMAKNISKVSKKGGFAAIDEGPSLNNEVIIPIMKKLGWKFIRPVRILPWKKSGQLLFRLPLSNG